MAAIAYISIRSAPNRALVGLGQLAAVTGRRTYEEFLIYDLYTGLEIIVVDESSIKGCGSFHFPFFFFRFTAILALPITALRFMV